jgi:flagellin
MERLSTGKRINSAADDAAGVAIATRMTSQSRGIEQAIRNAMDAQSMVDTAEGAQQESTNILQRMREVAVQASNDTNVSSDRVNLQLEITQLIAELDRISAQTTWNGMNVLDGSFSSKKFQIGGEANQTVSLSLDSTASSAIGVYNVNSTAQLSSTTGGGILDDTYTISGPDGSTTVTTVAGDSAKEMAARINGVTGTTGVEATAVNKVKLHTLTAADSIVLTINGTATNTVAITDNTDLRNLRDSINLISGTTGVVASLHEGSNAALQLVDADGDDISIAMEADGASAATELSMSALNADGTLADSTAGTDDLTVRLIDTGATPAAGESAAGGAIIATGIVAVQSYGAFNIQVANDGNDFANTAGAYVADGEFFGDGDGSAVSTTSATQTTVSTVKVTTQANAEAALSVIDGALDKLNNQRAKLGAMSNRLDSTVNNLSNINVNVKSAQSRIEDADFAKETSALTKAQILSQAATSMLAQANASKQSVLSLLQG